MAIWSLVGSRTEKFPPKFLSEKANKARQKIGKTTCKFLGHKFIYQEINFPIIRGFHIYSECVSCGKRKDEDVIPYEEMALRKKESP